MKTPTLETFLERALTCLRTIGPAEEPITFSSIRKALGDCTNANASRTLHTLVATGLLRRTNHPRGYLPTEKMRDLCWLILGRAPLHARMRQFIDEIGQQVRESVAIFEVYGRMIRMFVRKEYPYSHPLLSEGESRHDMGGHACAVALCAVNGNFSAKAGGKLRDDLDLNEEQFEQRLEQVRRDGYYLGYGEEYWLHRADRCRTLARLAIPFVPNDNSAAVYCLAISMNARSREESFSQKTIDWLLAQAHAFPLEE
ncbi:MAG: hypothetical protein AAGK14_05390 [Verrucomicrobiota bacterium]